VIVYSPAYDLHFLGLEKLHPFEGRKYSRAWREARKTLGEGLERLTHCPPHPIDRESLLAVHTEDYLDKLNSPRYAAQVVELPILASLPKFLIERRILRPMRLAAMGTLLAAREALNGGMAVNLGGGYHHASQDRGEGFCFYADINIALEALRRSGDVVRGQDRVLIVDLDVHQGNGHERVSMHDRDVYILDMYNRDIYPQDREARRRINCDVPLPSGADDALYLQQLRACLPQALREAGRPKIAFYVAGTDIYEHDLLGGLRVSAQGILERDRLVLNTLTSEGIPWVMLAGGGYSGESYRHIANSVCFVIQTWGDEHR